ncbi:DUF5686 family protein [Alkalitalea saponilacus]|uniref:CarboxypepD_reg-like domain-containing protein n=1 Tax=Alkalitalea saponilacus TaxID=889453 RepID=A0A1T5HSU6_9BACT|nr:DUF5686 family protein [Alkalitalea saponilacus]ASB48369.1 hypothetical protein CDL62_04035 [Alkalitalea saponilacus]SKC23601.1 CarboxypepD_reg-like domain-containing protein [Alkalitalea saponilacus]
MMLKKNTLIFFILLFCGSFNVISQNTLNFTVKNAENRTPVSFANIVFGDTQQGTVSDINGDFIIPHSTETKIIRISSLGYAPLTINTDTLQNGQTVLLKPVNIELDQVTILPGENPALRIIRNTVDNRDINNPDNKTPYSCIIYHKMTFGMEIPDTLITTNEETRRLWEFNRVNDILLIESVSERKHIPPSRTNERVISGRVSGFQQPTMAVLPSQLQPFTFYNNYIRLLDTDLLNPVSTQGLRAYLFLIEDTLIQSNGDTIFYISFEPRKGSNIRGMTGSLHIHEPTWGIQTVSATADENQLLYELSIRQNYKLHNNNHWFPEQLETKITMRETALGQAFPFPVTGEGRSMVTAVNLNPEFTSRDFSNLYLIDESGRPGAQPIDMHRYQPLTARDSATYHLLDSLGRAHNFDRFINLQRNLMEGFIPIGYVNLDVSKLINYNRYEGLIAGIGLQTSDRLSPYVSTGGFYTRSFKSRDDNFGANLRFRFNRMHEQSWKISAEKSLAPTGNFSFLDGYELTSSERYKNIAIETADPSRQINTAFTSRVFSRLKAQLAYQYKEVTPVMHYPYMLTEEIVPEFTTHESSLRLKWQPRIKLAYTGFGLTSTGGEMPSIWVNFATGQGDSSDESISYMKTETQFEHHFRITPVVKGHLRLTGAHLWGDHTPTHLYSAFGTYNSGLSIESRYSFATMAPNEFAANTFGLAFLGATIPTRINRSGSFKPEITLSTSAGWSEVASKYSETVSTFNKGYFESGIYFGNLFRQMVLKYGVGIHYRYGSYRNHKEINNWSFTIGAEIGF